MMTSSNLKKSQFILECEVKAISMQHITTIYSTIQQILAYHFSDFINCSKKNRKEKKKRILPFLIWLRTFYHTFIIRKIFLVKPIFKKSFPTLKTKNYNL